jgi:hypothetical protein
MTAMLIAWAYEHGYELTYGDAYRDPRSHGKLGERIAYGRKNSLHKQRLAVDFNLFKDGKWLKTTEDHRPLGEYWESIGGTWGGYFDDGNHYSYAHGGRR